MADRMPVLTCEDLAELDDDEIAEGYRDAVERLPCGDNRSRSYWHGWRTGQLDHGRRKKDDHDRLLAHDFSPQGNWNIGLRKVEAIRRARA